MVQVRTYQTAFVGGELASTVLGRIDKEFFTKGAEEARNVYVMAEGGLARREGLQFIDATTTSQIGRLVSFEFNDIQEYLLVFTPGEFKVYKNDVLQTTVTASPISTLTAAIIDEMNFTQSADVLILVHKDLQPIEISRTSDTVWTGASITFANIPTFDFGSGAEPVISVARGWPRSVVFHGGRLWLGGLGSRPQTILASKVGDFFDLDEGTALDDEALNITIDDDRVNAIRNLFSGRTLQVYTSGGEFSIQSQLGDPISPSKIAQQLNKATLHGSSTVRPVSTDGATIFIERGGHVVRQFIFNDFEQSFNSLDVSVLSSHIIREPTRMAVRTSIEDFPTDYVYLINNDGTCPVFVSSRDQDLRAWTLFETTGDFEDVIVVDKDVYFIVKRTINGAAVRHIEKLNPLHFMDASTRQTNAAFTNGTFDDDISGWTDISTGTGSIVHNSTDDRMSLLGGVSGVGIAEQSIASTTAVVNTIRADVSGGSIAVDIGTGSGLSDIATGTLAVDIQSELTFTSPGGTVFISFKNANDDTREIDNVELLREDWSELSHLEAETVKVRGDDFIFSDETVASGAIVSSSVARILEAGLNFAAKVTTVPLEANVGGLFQSGQFKRLVSANVRLYNSKDIVVQVDGIDHVPAFRQFGPSVLDQPIPLFTGWKKVYVGGVRRDSRVTITQSEPLEFILLLVAIEAGIST